MSETIGSDSAVGNGRNNVTEAYSFACLNCGHCWEQTYEIEHHVDPQGQPFVTYFADGVKVPSPLTHPSCANCDGTHVRIMRSGQVAGVASLWAVPSGDRGAHRAHHWSLAHFLHRRRGEPDTV
ncbi:hypothetical protein AB0M29_11500 [Streptomyces sp. NPDC051976]|uniref:hypothetical protein n=1 Tax=Streptomyces sp. NPDC051976 TaxID=3154947 RepID=UPI00341E7C70